MPFKEMGPVAMSYVKRDAQQIYLLMSNVKSIARIVAISPFAQTYDIVYSANMYMKSINW